MWLLGVVVALVVVLLIRKTQQACTYWRRKGIDQRSPFDVLAGIIKFNLKLVPVTDLIKDEYNALPKNRYLGSHQFGTTVLLLRDPELIKQITEKEFEHFTDHRAFVSEDHEPLWAKNLFALKVEEHACYFKSGVHKQQNAAMFTLMSEAGEQFTNYFLETGEEVKVELKDTFTRFTNDVIATCAFGVKCNSLKDRDNEFYVMGKDVTNFSGFWKTLSFALITASPRLAKVSSLLKLKLSTKSFNPNAEKGFWIGFKARTK